MRFERIYKNNKMRRNNTLKNKFVCILNTQLIRVSGNVYHISLAKIRHCYDTAEPDFSYGIMSQIYVDSALTLFSKRVFSDMRCIQNGRGSQTVLRNKVYVVVRVVRIAF